MASVLTSFDKWKQFLAERVNAAQNSGMNDETIVKLATDIGDFMSTKIDPENKEERLLKELWDAADEQERKTIARVMFKMVR
jgi:hypothetical protein